MRRAIILLTFTAAAIRQAATRWVTGITYHRSGRADRVTSQFWAGWDTGTEGNLTVDLPYLQDGYPGADLVPLPPWESTPQLVTTLNLPARAGVGTERMRALDPSADPVTGPGGESDSPGSHELPAPRAGGLNPDDWLMHPDPDITARTCCNHPGTGMCMCDCHDWEPADDSGLMPAVTEHIAAALGVPSRTRWLDEAFDRVLLDLHAEMAILDHRYAYRELVAA